MSIGLFRRRLGFSHRLGLVGVLLVWIGTGAALSESESLGFSSPGVWLSRQIKLWLPAVMIRPSSSMGD